MDRLAAMRSFVEVADRGGFAAAGRVLKLSGPMVGNHVRFLETELGGLLLNRTTRAQQLTELGRFYVDRCRKVLDEIEAAEAGAQEMLGAPRGRLRMTAPHSIGSTILPPIIARFASDHPTLAVDLHLDDGRLDLLADGFDVAIRVGNLQDATLITRALAPLELVLCAAPAYLTNRERPETLADLASHSCLDFAGSSNPGTWCFDAADGVQEIAVRGPFRANSGYALRSAAIVGLGIVLLPRLLLDQDIASGRLVVLLDRWHPQSRPVQLLSLPDRHPTPKLRLFIEALIRELDTRSRVERRISASRQS